MDIKLGAVDWGVRHLGTSRISSMADV